MTQLIDVSDILPARLLAELFNNASEDRHTLTKYDQTDNMGQLGAQTMLNKTNFVDKGAYFESIRGRTLRVTITGWRIHPFQYDKIHGTGAVQTIVDTIRANP